MKVKHHFWCNLLIWHALVATIVSAVPHFDCICPNGAHKPYCFSEVVSGISCCPSDARDQLAGNGTFNDEMLSRNSGDCPLCHVASKATRINSLAQVQMPGCRKTFVNGSELAANPLPQDDVRDLAGANALMASPIGLDSDSVIPRLDYHRTSRLHNSLPPDDLVITLCHFVI